MELDREVEVVADALMRGMFAPHELPLDHDLEQKYRKLAVAAIEALRSLEETADEIERLRAALLLAKVALYNPFEPNNQSNTYKHIEAALGNDQIGMED